MSPRIEGHASVAITATRGLPIPTKPVGYAKRTPVRSGHVPIKCGTAEGYERHRELGYRPCLMCIKAVESQPERPAKKRQTVINHGTPWGYTQCRRANGKACDDCRAANTAYHRQQREKNRKPRTDYVTRFPTFDVQAARADYESGMSVNECSAKYGVGRETIRRQLIKAGTQMRLNPRARPIDDEAVAKLYAQGLLISAVAARLGYSYTGCYKALRRAGVEIRDDRPRSAS